MGGACLFAAAGVKGEDVVEVKEVNWQDASYMDKVGHTLSDDIVLWDTVGQYVSKVLHVLHYRSVGNDVCQYDHKNLGVHDKADNNVLYHRNPCYLQGASCVFATLYQIDRNLFQPNECDQRVEVQQVQVNTKPY